MKSISILLMCMVLVGCSKSDNSKDFAYLNDEMNAKVSVRMRKIVTLEFTNDIHVEKLGFKRVGNILISPDRAEVKFYPDHIDLYLVLDVSNQATTFEWRDTKTIEERRKVGDTICEAHIRRLADDLKCELSAIQATWICPNADVDGKVAGSSLPNEISEQDVVE